MEAKNQSISITPTAPAFRCWRTATTRRRRPVDRTKDDVDYNQSLMQRISHLIHDATRSVCNKQDAQFSLLLTFGPYDSASCSRSTTWRLFLQSSICRGGVEPERVPASAVNGANFVDHIMFVHSRLRKKLGRRLLESQVGSPASAAIRPGGAGTARCS